jgi:hypothetical protein
MALTSLFVLATCGDALAVASDSMKLTSDAAGMMVLTNPFCPRPQRMCEGSIEEGDMNALGGELRGSLQFRVPMPAAGLVFRDGRVSLFEGNDPNNISDVVTLHPELGGRAPRPNFTVLVVTFASDPGSRTSPLTRDPVNNIAEDPTIFQNLTAMLFANSTAPAPFQVQFNSDCDAPAAPIHGNSGGGAPSTACGNFAPLPFLAPEPASALMLAASLFGLRRAYRSARKR